MAPSLSLAIRSMVLQISVSLSSRLHPQSYGKTKCVSKESFKLRGYLSGVETSKVSLYLQICTMFFHTGLECMLDVYVTSILCMKAYV